MVDNRQDSELITREGGRRAGLRTGSRTLAVLRPVVIV